MNLMCSILLIYLLLEVCGSMRNFHLPHAGGYFHHSDMAMQHDNNYRHYDTDSSEEVVMRHRQSPRRTKYQRHFEYSDSEYNYKCKCSCTKCQKRKMKPKPCCEDFCSTQCTVQNNILVVPYPVPFIVFNQSSPSDLPPPMPTMPPTMPPMTSRPTTSSSTTTTTTTTEEPTTLQITFSTAPYFDGNPYKRFQIINEKSLRRNMGMGNNDFRSPHKFGRLPKYGIVPIPENYALSLMQQIRKDQKYDQLRKRLAFDKRSTVGLRLEGVINKNSIMAR